MEQLKAHRVKTKGHYPPSALPETFSNKSSAIIAQTRKEPIKDEVTLSMFSTLFNYNTPSFITIHKAIDSLIHRPLLILIDLNDTHQAQQHLDLVDQPKVAVNMYDMPKSGSG